VPSPDPKVKSRCLPFTPDPDAGLSQPEIEDDLLARWPHLAKPGPQPCNRIAGTLEEQFSRVFLPREPELLPPAEHARLVGALAEDIALIAAEVTRGLRVKPRRSEYGEYGEYVSAKGERGHHVA
jgi:hypothetical protein